MTGESKPVMQCTEWEALLADALDGALHGSTLAGFEEHQQACGNCGRMYQEAAEGMHWMKGLEEAEPPKFLVHNILAQTIGAMPEPRVPVAQPAESWWARLKGKVSPAFAPVVTPRFAMSFGMAFFSITMLLNVAGFHVSDLQKVDLSWKGLEKTYYTTEAKVVRYYENIRLVYEIESRVRDLRRAAQPERKQEEPATPAPTNTPKGTSLKQNSNPQPLQHDEVRQAGVSNESNQARLNRRTA